MDAAFLGDPTDVRNWPVLNPLAAHPSYEPLTRGMRAAIPHTDRLLPGNSLASLEELAVMLEAL